VTNALLVILGAAIAFSGTIVRGLAGDELKGRLHRHTRYHVETAIASLPAEIEARRAAELRAELAEMISMPLTAAQWARRLRRSTTLIQATIASLPAEMQAKRAVELHAQLAEILSNPLKTRRWARDLRRTAAPFYHEPESPKPPVNLTPPPAQNHIKPRYALDTRLMALASLAAVLGRMLTYGTGGSAVGTIVAALIAPSAAAFVTVPGVHHTRRVAAVIVLSFLVAAVRHAVS